MRQAVDGDRKYGRIREDNLVDAFGRRITVEGGVHVLGQPAPEINELAQKKQRLPFGDVEAVIARVTRVSTGRPDASIHFLSKPRVYRIEDVSHVVLDVRALDILP